MSRITNIRRIQNEIKKMQDQLDIFLNEEIKAQKTEAAVADEPSSSEKQTSPTPANPRKRRVSTTSTSSSSSSASQSGASIRIDSRESTPPVGRAEIVSSVQKPIEPGLNKPNPEPNPTKPGPALPPEAEIELLPPPLVPVKKPILRGNPQKETAGFFPSKNQKIGANSTFANTSFAETPARREITSLLEVAPIRRESETQLRREELGGLNNNQLIYNHPTLGRLELTIKVLDSADIRIFLTKVNDERLMVWRNITTIRTDTFEKAARSQNQTGFSNNI